MDKTNEYTQRKHFILDIPYIGPALLFVYGYAVTMVSCGVAYLYIPDPYFYYVAVLFGILMVIIHRLWFRNEFRGGLYTESLKDKKIWIAFFLIVLIDSSFYLHDIIECGFEGIAAEGIAAAAMGGICEEVSDRYLVISTMMRKYKKTGNYVPVLIFSALLFGLSHYFNMHGMEQFWPVTLQVVATICSGIAMGAIYIRTGNILLSMGWHFLHDLLGSMVTQVSEVNPTFLGVSKGSVLEVALSSAFYIIFAVVLLKGQKDNVSKVWNNRWP